MEPLQPRVVADQPVAILDVQVGPDPDRRPVGKVGQRLDRRDPLELRLEALLPVGEPQGSLLFYAVYLYQQGFRYFNMGLASAMAWVLFGATMLCTLALIKSSERWVHVEGGR